MGEHQKVFIALFHQPAQMRRFFLPVIQELSYILLILLIFFNETSSRISASGNHDLKHCLPVNAESFFV